MVSLWYYSQSSVMIIILTAQFTCEMPAVCIGVGVYVYNCITYVYTWCCSQLLHTADGDLLVDYSKNIINDEVMKMLVDLVDSPCLLRCRHSKPVISLLLSSQCLTGWELTVGTKLSDDYDPLLFEPHWAKPVGISGWNLSCRNLRDGATVQWKLHDPN